MSKRGIHILCGIAAIVIALVCVWWALQTAWLGSFPGRDAEAAGRWALLQLVGGVAFFVVAVVAFWRAKKN